eukprot:gene3272-5715_t
MKGTYENETPQKYNKTFIKESKVPIYHQNYTTVRSNRLGVTQLFNLPGKRLGIRAKTLGLYSLTAFFAVYWAFRPTKEDWDYYFVPKE